MIRGGSVRIDSLQFQNQLHVARAVVKLKWSAILNYFYKNLLCAAPVMSVFTLGFVPTPVHCIDMLLTSGSMEHCLSKFTQSPSVFKTCC